MTEHNNGLLSISDALSDLITASECQNSPDPKRAIRKLVEVLAYARGPISDQDREAADMLLRSGSLKEYVLATSMLEFIVGRRDNWGATLPKPVRYGPISGDDLLRKLDEAERDTDVGKAMRDAHSWLDLGDLDNCRDEFRTAVEALEAEVRARGRLSAENQWWAQHWLHCGFQLDPRFCDLNSEFGELVMRFRAALVTIVMGWACEDALSETSQND